MGFWGKKKIRKKLKKIPVCEKPVFEELKKIGCLPDKIILNYFWFRFRSYKNRQKGRILAN